LLRQQALFQPNSDFTNEFVLTGNDAFSNYHALQLQFRKTFASSFQALLSYTWSHSFDNSSSDQVIGLSGAVISAAKDYASSDFDTRQSFSGAVSYSIPSARGSQILSALTRDWSVEGLVVTRTGFPFNAIVVGRSGWNRAYPAGSRSRAAAVDSRPDSAWRQDAELRPRRYDWSVPSATHCEARNGGP
jgi:hypothetical protein